jgi:hypothetical protein
MRNLLVVLLLFLLAFAALGLGTIMGRRGLRRGCGGGHDGGEGSRGDCHCAGDRRRP